MGCQWYLGNISHDQINIIYLEPFPMIGLITASHTCAHSTRKYKSQRTVNIQANLWGHSAEIEHHGCLMYSMDRSLSPTTDQQPVSECAEDPGHTIRSRETCNMNHFLCPPGTTRGNTVWEDSFHSLGQLYEREVLLAFEAHSHQNNLRDKVVIYI